MRDRPMPHRLTDIGNSGRSDPLAAPVIGDRVEIGAGAKVLGAIRVGSDAVVGANAVVVRDVESGSVVGGVPARVLASHVFKGLS